MWDFEATLYVIYDLINYFREIVDVKEPVVIKVTDSDDHHIGQVVIPLVQIPSRPANTTGKLATDANLKVADLEPTNKVSNVHGSLYYWIWAESYYDDTVPEKSSRGSTISVHRSASKLSS